jgi:hypothetical protein
VAVEIAHDDERNAIGVTRPDPIDQRGSLFLQFFACAMRLLVQRAIEAAGLQVDGEDTQRRGLQCQRDVDTAAQRMARPDVERRDIRIDIIMDALTHHDADTLHDVVAAHLDRVFVARKDTCCDDWAVHFLDGDHVGIELCRVLLQMVDVR